MTACSRSTNEATPSTAIRSSPCSRSTSVSISSRSRQILNLGFHRLMAERGVRVVTTDVGDRYVLEALHREGGLLGGEQSGHIIYLRDHVTGDGLAAALLLCGALSCGRPLSEVASAMPRFPQAKENVRVRSKGSCRRPFAKRSSASTPSSPERAGSSSGRRGRSRSYGYSQRPKRMRKAEALCARIAALVRRELG